MHEQDQQIQKAMKNQILSPIGMQTDRFGLVDALFASTNEKTQNVDPHLYIFFQIFFWGEIKDWIDN